MDKHSYIGEKKKDSTTKNTKESGTTKNDQKELPRTDPDLKKGYNEKNPSQPQGGFTPNSQADEKAEVHEGDESEK